MAVGGGFSLRGVRSGRHPDVSLSAMLAMSVHAQDVPKTQAQALAYEKADRMPATSLTTEPSPRRPAAPGS